MDPQELRTLLERVRELLHWYEEKEHGDTALRLRLEVDTAIEALKQTP